MVEMIMYAALGFLAATLLALLILPAVWRRAVRLTTLRIERALPVSMTEFLADKDQLRAQFAVAVRRLELKLDAMQAQHAEGEVERSRHVVRIGELDADRAALSTELADLEESRRATLARAEAAEAERDAHEAALAEMRAGLETAQAELAESRSRTAEADGIEESWRIENAAVATRAEGLSQRVGELERTVARDLATLTRLEETLAAERTARDATEARLAGTETALAAAREEAAELARRLGEAHRQQQEERAPALPDPMESARLRDTIGHIAAEVARMTATLEGEGSPITAILDGASPPPSARKRGRGRGKTANSVAANGAAADATTDPTQVARPLNLVERIRALQIRAAQGIRPPHNVALPDEPHRLMPREDEAAAPAKMDM
ncbi:hypothetical protein MWN34_06430 [Ancylobacter sp. 6x-1]|uniref:Chromosome partition protein Smc n=1 Tax=Ancylobacter crimeensis TaxID=2579147 RepID=A0ABT0D9R9_9HYPH|nr:hypothetical protein [Ancylobacter crimeensis]MCK0196547.1 hypothetical protein [Ancylobacter crimeensis]